MRRQDELLALYPGRDLLTRKFILSQVEGLSMSFDSDELLEFLQGALGDEDPVIRNQALFTLTRFLPGYIRKRYALSANTIGVWSTYEQHRDQIQSLIQKGNEISARTRERRNAFLLGASNLSNVLLRLSRHTDSRIVSVARLALAQMPTRAVATSLLEACRAGEPTFGTVLPFAMVVEGEEHARALLEIINKNMDRVPDLCMLVCVLPPQVAFQSIMDLAPRTSSLGRMNLALALARITRVNHQEAIDQLCRHGEGWVQIYCLRVIESLGNEAFLSRLREVCHKAQHDFIRVQAIRSVGSIPGDDSIDLCIQSLKNSSEAVKAQALESLVRLQCPADTLSREAAPFLDSLSLRARVNAILATTSAREQQPPRLRQLLLSSETIGRLEAAYCLGYLQNRQNLASLETLVTHDPNRGVRVQALKSLSKYPARHCLPRILPVLRGTDSRLALAAARVLDRFDGDEGSAICEALLHQVEKSQSKFERALLYRTIGTLAARSGSQRADRVLHKGLLHKDSKIVAGAIEGWITRGGETISKEASTFQEIAQAGDKRGAPRALMGLALGGNLTAMDGLTALLAHKDPAHIAPVSETVLEFCLLVAEEATSFRYPLLGKALDQIVDSEGVDQLASTGEFRNPALGWTRPQEEGPDLKDVENEFVVSRSLKRATKTILAESASPGPSKKRAGSSPTSAPEVATSDRTSGTSGSAGVVAADSVDERDEADAAILEANNELRQHLQRPQVRQEASGQDLPDKLRKLTYLIGEKLDAPALVDGVVRFRLLAAPVAVAVVIFGILVFGYSVTGGGEVEAGAALVPEYVHGSVRLDRLNSVLEDGTPLEVGDEIKTEREQKVRLITRSGNRITILGSSSLAVTAIQNEGPDLHLEVERGHYMFHFAKPGKLMLRYGRFQLSGEGFVCSLEDYQGKFSLIMDAGKVAFEETGQGTQELKTGDIRLLD